MNKPKTFKQVQKHIYKTTWRCLSWIVDVCLLFICLVLMIFFGFVRPRAVQLELKLEDIKLTPSQTFLSTTEPLLKLAKQKMCSKQWLNPSVHIWWAKTTVLNNCA